MSDGIADIGALTQAGLAAREIDKGGGENAGHDRPEACANCGTALIGAHCHACGQRGHVHRTISHFAGEVGHGVFHFEGKVWRTLPMLALRPGELTRRYARGERTRFVSPMALFLFTVFLMFAVVGHLGSGVNLVHDRNAAEPLDEAVVATQKARDKLAAAGQPTAELDAKLTRLKAASAAADKGAARGPRDFHVDIGSPALNRKIHEEAANPHLLAYKLKSSAYKFSWALIPISLPFLWLLFPFRRDTTLYDHAVFATYSLSFMSMLVIAGALLGLLGDTPLPALLALVVPVHMFLQLRDAYGLSRSGALWRTVLLLCFCLAAGIAFLLLILALDLWG